MQSDVSSDVTMKNHDIKSGPAKHSNRKSSQGHRKQDRREHMDEPDG